MADVLTEHFSSILSQSISGSDVEAIKTILQSNNNTSGAISPKLMTNIIQECYSMVSSETMPLTKLRIVEKNMYERFGTSRTLEGFSLAMVVDDISYHLRVTEKQPASRWATFVHIGI